MVFAEAFNLYSKCYICGWLHPYMSNRSQDMKCVLRNKCYGSHFYEPLSLFTTYSIEKHSYLSTNSIVNWKTFLSQSIDSTCALCFSFLIWLFFFCNSTLDLQGLKAINRGENQIYILNQYMPLLKVWRIGEGSICRHHFWKNI